MSPDEFGYCSPLLITVDRATRQRKTIDTSDLDDSIRLRGILQPIIIDRNNGLVAGERRLASAIKVGLQLVPYRFVDTLDPVELQILELEENLKRSDLPWRDSVKAVGLIHDLYSTRSPGWTQTQTSELVCLSMGFLTQCLRIYREIDAPFLAQASSIASAYNLLLRMDERKIADAMGDISRAGASLFSPPSGGDNAPTQDLGPTMPITVAPGGATPGGIIYPSAMSVAPKPPPVQEEAIQNLDFIEWLKTYTGPTFNFLHCDFPYGVHAFDGSQSVGAASSSDINLAEAKTQLYDDNPEVYWELIEALCHNLDKIMAPSAHIMFWFSMQHYEETLHKFRLMAPSLNISPTPLIWIKSDNRGIISDAKRGPRNIYETALFGSREDRFIVRPVSNAHASPTDKLYHQSTKPEPMLRYFFGMFVDDSTRMLDPTCGSGSALRAAESLGAKVILGLEKDPEHCSNAKRALLNFRNLRKVSGQLSGDPL